MTYSRNVTDTTKRTDDSWTSVKYGMIGKKVTTPMETPVGHRENTLLRRTVILLPTSRIKGESILDWMIRYGLILIIKES